jgi:arylformamidase
MSAVYRDFDQGTLDREYNARATVEDAEIFIRDYGGRSKDARDTLPCLLDVPYGAHPDAVVDLFPAGKAAPVFIFIHGGYWRALSQRDSAFMAPAFVGRGISVVAVNYSLAPEASLDTIVRQCREALSWVWQFGPQAMNIDPNRIFVGGSSAGGHLTGMMVAGGWHEAFGVPADIVKGAISFSGLHDLEPIRLSNINEWARLDQDSAERNSPIHHLPETGCPLIVTVGDLETFEFKRQAKIYADAWKGRGWPCSHFEVADRNHFDIVFDLCDPATRVARELFAMMGG